jgi:hypothetical protein
MAIVIKNGIITELKTSTSGKNLAFGDFVGKAFVSGSVVALLTPTQLLTNSDFSSGTTGWTASGGFGTWSFT